MSLHRVPYCLRALLLGACCLPPLAGCDLGTHDAHAVAGASGFSPLPLAEREARHFDVYMQYRAVFDRPRRLLSDALQDDAGPTHVALQFVSGDTAACSRRHLAAD